MTEPLLPYFISTKSGPFVLEFEGYPDESSYDFAAGFVGAMREYAHRWHLHRETMDRFDEEFVPICEKISGVLRKIDKKATAADLANRVKKDNIPPIYETRGRYYARLERECEPAILDELRVQALILSRTFKINITPAERTRSVEPLYFKRADSWLEVLSTENLTGKVEALLPKAPGFRPELNGDDRITRDSLARLMQLVDENELAMQD